MTVDVRGRERRQRRPAAIDARESAAEAAEAGAAPETEPARPGRRFARRDEPLLEPREPVLAEPDEDPRRTQALDPVEPTQE